MAHKYKSVRKPTFDRAVNRISPEMDTEILVGSVQGITASDIEERFAKSLYKKQISFRFQESFFAGRNMPGEVRLDFLITDLFIQPVQVDGEFAHKTAAQKERDRLNDARLDNHLSGTGALPTIRIPGEFLQTQEDSDRQLSELDRWHT